MSNAISQAANNQTPDSTQGGLAVTGNNNSGHGATNSITNAGGGSSNGQTKTCRWFNFLSAGQVLSITLRFDWTIAGSLDKSGPGPASATALFRVEHSVNNGGSWSTSVTRSTGRSTNGTTPISDSGSETITTIPSSAYLVPSIQVRDRVDVSCESDPGGLANASLTASVSNIRLEVTFNNSPIIMM